MLVVLLSLSGCVWLPVGGDDHFHYQWSGEDWISLIGTDKATLRRKLAMASNRSAETVLWQELTEPDRTHLLFRSSRDFGLVIFASTHNAGGGLMGWQTTCYRLSFDDQGKLYDAGSIAADTDFLAGLSSDDAVDCRKAFWSTEELASIRAFQENLAAKGDRDALLIMAKEHGDTAPLREYVIDNQDIPLARTLAEEYGDFSPLTEFARNDEVAERELERAVRARGPSTRFVPVTAKAEIRAEIAERANSGDAEAQFALYRTKEESLSTPDRLRWLCLAADQGHPLAQSRLGDLYWFGDNELNKNLALSYKWHRLSSVKGTSGAKRAIVTLKSSMTPDELEKAEQAYVDWRPGQCQSEVEQHRKSGH